MRRPCACALAAAAVAGLVPAAAHGRTIGEGHVDVVAARVVGGDLVASVRDASGSRPVWRDPADVTVRVGRAAAVRLPSGLGFLGPRGMRVWILPQEARDGTVWPGWSTEGVPRSAVRGALRWTLRRVTGPGKVAVFRTGAFGEATVLFDSGRRLPQSTTLAPGTHAHGNWAFTRRGAYGLHYSLAGRSPRGKAMTARATLRFRVG